MNRPVTMRERGGLIMPRNWGKWVFAGVFAVSLLYFAWLLF